ncbi:MAG: 3-methyl-2-oxobutanoate hydroxymethyltransferase [Phycisphaera sp.]|nr:3-methyl-2-oxobutanoate hydroxymethyltransferase [Phycisphaera sp.]
MPEQTHTERVTLRTLRAKVRAGEKFAMLTCYDATTARWLWQGGIQAFLVGDTAAQFILGHDSTLPASMPFMLEITAAVRRGAPGCFLMADMPFGSYQCGDDEALRNASLFLSQGGADAVKLEVDETFEPLVSRMVHAGVPVVAHLGSRPQAARQTGGYHSAGRTPAHADAIVRAACAMIDAGVSMILLEATPQEVSDRVVERAASISGSSPYPRPVVVVGCGAGPACHGHVVVLQDLVGMTDWQPPFVKPIADLGKQLSRAADRWARLVASGRYLLKDHPYPMIEQPPRHAKPHTRKPRKR